MGPPGHKVTDAGTMALRKEPGLEAGGEGSLECRQSEGDSPGLRWLGMLPLKMGCL